MTKYREINLKAKAKLIISKELQSQIMCLHNQVQDIEWSGTLFHSVASGNINDPENLVLKAEKVFLQDVGVGTYTEFETDETILDFYDQYPAIEKGWKQGLIHSHHTMACFFSGEDTSELHTNAGKYNYYLSLIVNHKSQFCAKIAIVAKYSIEKELYTFKGFNGEETIETKGSQTDVLMVIDCNIEFEQDKFELDRYAYIKAEKAKKAISMSFVRHAPGFNLAQPGLFQGRLFEDKGIAPPINQVSELEIRKYLVSLLSISESGTKEMILSDVLHNVNKYKGQQLSTFYTDIDLNVEYFIGEHFPDIINQKDVDDILNESIKVLDKYKSFKITESIIGILMANTSVFQTSTKKAKFKK